LQSSDIPQPERIGTDTRLLLASLEKEAVEDEAEAVRLFSVSYAYLYLFHYTHT